MNPLFDEERFRALLAVEASSPAGGPDEPVPPPGPLAGTWEVRGDWPVSALASDTAAVEPEPVDEEPPVRRVPKTSRPELVSGPVSPEGRADVLYRAGEIEAGEGADTVYRVEPGMADVPEAGGDGLPDMTGVPVSGAAGMDVRYRVEDGLSQQGREPVPGEVSGQAYGQMSGRIERREVLYRSEDPAWDAEDRDWRAERLELGDDLVLPGRVRSGERDRPAAEVRSDESVRLAENASFRDWDRQWEREERRYDGGFVPF